MTLLLGAWGLQDLRARGGGITITGLIIGFGVYTIFDACNGDTIRRGLRVAHAQDLNEDG